MHHRLLGLFVFALAMLTLTGAARGADLQSLMSTSLEAKRQRQSIEQARRKAVSEVQSQMHKLSRLVRQLEGEPADQQKIAEYRQQLAQYERQLARARQAIDRLKQQIEFAKLEDPQKRQAKAQALEKQRQQVQDKYEQKAAPFDKRLQALRQKYADQADAFEKAVASFAQAPGDPYPNVTVARVSARMSNGFISYHWEDGDGNRVAWAHLRLHAESDAAEDAEKLAGQYPIQSSSGQSIWFWAGQFQVAFVASSEALKGADTLREAAPKFFDLERMAGLRIAPKAGDSAAATQPASGD